MKKVFLSVCLAVIMLTAVMPVGMVFAATTAGVEYKVDFSTWTTGTYSLADITAELSQGPVYAENFNAQMDINWEIVNDALLGRNVLKVTNNGTSQKGVKFYLASPVTGKIISYDVLSRLATTVDSKAFHPKHILANRASTNLFSSGGNFLKRSEVNNFTTNTDFNGLEYAREIFTMDTTSNRKVQWILNGNKIVATSPTGGGYDAWSRATVYEVQGVGIYSSDPVVTGYVAELSFRTFPIVAKSTLYSGANVISDTQEVPAAADKIEVMFDHAMNPATLISNNVKLYNITDASYVFLSNSDITYNSVMRTMSINTVGKLSSSKSYRVELTSDIGNIDNIALENQNILFTTVASVLSVVSAELCDTQGAALSGVNVIPSKAAAYVLTADDIISNQSAHSVTLNDSSIPCNINGDILTINLAGQLSDGNSYTISISNLEGVSGNILTEHTYSFNTRKASEDFYFNDFNDLTPGTTVNAAALQNSNTNVTMVAYNNIDGIFEVTDDNKIKVTKTLANATEQNGLKMTFPNNSDLFTLLGNENVVVELDYYVDVSTLSTYSAFTRMNLTAVLKIQDNVLSQQLDSGVGDVDLAVGVNKQQNHYKTVLNKNGTFNFYINGERIKGNNSYDIPFRRSGNLPNVWEIYTEKGDPTYYTFDNLRIRNYPEAQLSFLSPVGTAYLSDEVFPTVSTIYVNFDNKMANFSSSAVKLYDSENELISCTVGNYDPIEQRISLNVGDLLTAGETYKIVLDDSVVNTQNKAVGTNILNFTVADPEPVSLISASASGGNEITLVFDGPVNVDSMTAGAFEIKDDDYNYYTIEKIDISQNSLNIVKITVDESLSVGYNTIELYGGLDYCGREFLGKYASFEAVDKIYTGTVICVPDVEGNVNPSIEVTIMNGSEISSLLFLAGYYEDGKLISIVATPYTELTAGMQAITAGEFSVAIQEPEAKVKEIRMFIWDNYTQKPLCDKIIK